MQLLLASGKHKTLFSGKIFLCYTLTLDSWFSLALTYPVWILRLFAPCFCCQVVWITCFLNSDTNGTAYSVIRDINYIAERHSVTSMYSHRLYDETYIACPASDSSSGILLLAWVSLFFPLKALLKDHLCLTLLKKSFTLLPQLPCKVLGQFNKVMEGRCSRRSCHHPKSPIFSCG